MAAASADGVVLSPRLEEFYRSLSYQRSEFSFIEHNPRSNVTGEMEFDQLPDTLEHLYPDENQKY